MDINKQSILFTGSDGRAWGAQADHTPNIDPCIATQPDELTALRQRIEALEAERDAFRADAERDTRTLVAAFTAHRGCCGTEHDPANGKLHGYCVICGVPWPCEVAQVAIDAARKEVKL